MAKIIILLALATIANCEVCFVIKQIKDFGGPTRQIDFSQLVVKNNSINGNVNVLSDIISPLEALYNVIEMKNGAITNTLLGLPIKDLCNDLENSNALYSPILQRFDTKQCPVKKCAGQQLGHRAPRIENPRFSNLYAIQSITLKIMKDLCKDLSDSAAVYEKILQRLNTKQCPVAKGSYNMTGVTLDLTSVQPSLMDGMDYVATTMFLNDILISAVQIVGETEIC